MDHNQFIELLDLRYSAFVDLPELNGVQYSVIEIKDQNSFLILQQRVNKLILLLSQSTTGSDHLSFEVIFLFHLKKIFFQIQLPRIHFFKAILTNICLNFLMLAKYGSIS